MSQDGLRVIFAGTPEFAACSLAAVLASRHPVVAVFTQPDRPRGRGRRLQGSPVKQLATENDIPVHQPEKLDVAAVDAMRGYRADLLVVVAYGLILPASALESCRLGAVNVHASLLPRWRGAAPIQRAIQAGDTVTGITIMAMDEGLDTGAMLARCERTIRPTDTGGSLHDLLARDGAELLVRCLDQFATGSALPDGEAQDPGKATYARKLDKGEAAIDWSLDAPAIERTVRAFNPWPVATARAGGEVVRIFSAEALPLDQEAEPGSLVTADSRNLVVACGKGALSVLELQFPGGRPMAVADAMNSRLEPLRELGRLD